jgi:small subunit ribosomal protein S6
MPKGKPKVEQNQYEAMFLLGPSFATEIENAQKLVRGMIEKHDGQIIVMKKWDERKLAYELEGQKRGLYIITFFKALSAAIGAIEREVNLSDQVLRVLITRADHLNADEMALVEPQPIQPREERPNTWDRPLYDERPERGDRADRGDRPERSDRPPMRGGRGDREQAAEAAAGKD